MPGPARRQRPQQRHGQRQREHRRRVNGGKAVDEGLHGRALALRLLHGVDDAGQLRVLRRRCHAHQQRAAQIQRAGVHRVALALVHRQAFARDGGLIDGALALNHRAVQRQARARLGADHAAGGHLCGGQLAPGFAAFAALAAFAVFHAHFRLRGGHVQQAGDGAARAVHGARFQMLGQGVKRHHHCRLGPLANGESARNGHGHQRADGKPRAPERRQPLGIRAKARQQHRQRRQRHARCGPGFRREGVPQLRAQRQRQRRQRAPQRRRQQQRLPGRLQARKQARMQVRVQARVQV